MVVGGTAVVDVEEDTGVVVEVVVPAEVVVVVELVEVVVLVVVVVVVEVSSGTRALAEAPTAESPTAVEAMTADRPSRAARGRRKFIALY